MTVRWLMAAALLGVSAGCVSPPPIEDRTLPWTNASDDSGPDAVWSGLRAATPDLSSPLTLAALTDLALQNSPGSRQAWSEARAASEQVKQAEGYFMPSLTAVANGTRSALDAQPEGFDQDLLKYGPGLRLNYLILNFGGGRKAAVEAALQLVYSRNFAFNRSIQDVLLRVETAYYGLVSARAGIDAANAAVSDSETALKAATALKDAGLGTPLDVLQAQASRDQARYQLAVARGGLQTAQGALALAVGLPADAPLVIVPPVDGTVPAIAEAELRAVIDDAVQRRPDIAALRATLASREAAVRIAGSDLWPSLSLNGSVDRDYYDTMSGKDFQDEDWSYGAGLSLEWTVFDGMQSLHARRAARAEADAARARLEQAELVASADVWSRYHELATAHQKLEFSTAFLSSAGESHALALKSYQAGLKSILDLLNAERQLAAARSQQIAARQEVFVALASLAHATGVLTRAGAADAIDEWSTTTTEEDTVP